jgi:hypothetical protein
MNELASLGSLGLELPSPAYIVGYSRTQGGQRFPAQVVKSGSASTNTGQSRSNSKRSDLTLVWLARCR